MQNGKKTTTNNNRPNGQVIARRSKKKINNRSSQKTNNSQNISNATVKKYSEPKVSDKSHGITVKKREFVCNIVPQDPFTPVKVEFNPGLQVMFPWLSGVAPNFEKYRVRKILFHYETSQSTFVPGMVMFAPEFNISDAMPSTKSELLEYAFATRAPVWKNFSMEIPSNVLMNYKEYYVRVNELSVQNDKKLYDPMFLIYATDAVSTDISYAGELWVEYEIELLYPQRISYSILMFNSFRTYTFVTCSNSAPFANLNGYFGGLLMEIVDSSHLRFKMKFTGYLNLRIDVSNLGLADKFYTNPPNYTLDTPGSGTITPIWYVGGNSSASGPDYISGYWSIKNALVDDLLTFHNLGFDASGGTHANGLVLIFQSGYVQ